eukprot:TRINITY_DN3582_c0_g1_i1.p1 TRINITY_DN3582_c0_g1~~TRINITY_DN3582_c0_g1_i1.p1  ORF type:complete len:238 (-),score=29.30 TRINITY_DN3582_c0_g1_i1:65-778(-)
MSKYPVTNLKYSFIVTLKANEEFVRLRVHVENPTDKTALAEAWLPMTFPINDKSQIISQQVLRWRRDEWCFDDTANLIHFNRASSGLLHPLSWKGDCILYDFPTMNGNYHAVNLPSSSSKGMAFITSSLGGPHFTKLWSWGNKTLFNREAELKKKPPLGAGRPAKEYYEPWSSSINNAFFETAEFFPRTYSAWEVAILPMRHDDLGSDSIDLLRKTVETHVGKIPDTIPAPQRNVPF